jgi:hypothetical protein
MSVLTATHSSAEGLTKKSIRAGKKNPRSFSVYQTPHPLFLVYVTCSLNFTYLISELRRRCPDALYDERLLSRAGQVALLGPSLNPEEHLIVATALLRKVLGSKIG